jgi:hypothetical protein
VIELKVSSAIASDTSNLLEKSARKTVSQPEAESRALTSDLSGEICPITSRSKRDIEPAVQFLTEKELPLLRSENFGSECRIVAVTMIF